MANELRGWLDDPDWLTCQPIYLRTANPIAAKICVKQALALVMHHQDTDAKHHIYHAIDAFFIGGASPARAYAEGRKLIARGSTK